MNCLRHFWKENSTKWIFQTWIVTLMSLQKQHAKHFNHCSSSMLFHPIPNIQIIMAQWIFSTICLTSSGPQGLLIQSNYIFDWQLTVTIPLGFPQPRTSKIDIGSTYRLRMSGPPLGCKPFQGKILEIEILCSSDSVFSSDSEYGFKKS